MAQQAMFRIWRGDASGGAVPGFQTPSGRRHGGAGRRSPHPGRTGARSRGAMELQGRQVRVVLGRNQRHAEADVHDTAERTEPRHAGHRRADARVSLRSAIW